MCMEMTVNDLKNNYIASKINYSSKRAKEKLIFRTQLKHGFRTVGGIGVIVARNTFVLNQINSLKTYLSQANIFENEVF